MLRYILKYLVFRALPFTAVSVSLLGALSAAVYRTDRENFTLCVIMCAAVIAVIIGWFTCGIIRFSRMIGSQTARYGVPFTDKGAVTLEWFELWVILSDNWLIQPGRLALCREHIVSVSVSDFARERGGVRYEVRLKTKDGGRYRLRLRSKAAAGRVRGWAK